MTWFRRLARERVTEGTGHPTRIAPPAPVPTPSWWLDPVVQLGFQDGSVVSLPPGDPRTRTFVTVAEALRGSSGSPVWPI